MSLDAGEEFCASIPLVALASLAGLRREPGVVVTVRGDRAFVVWSRGPRSILDRVRPLEGLELYVREGGLWYRQGERLPTFGLPTDEADAVPLDRAVTPSPVRPIDAADGPPVAAELTLTRDERPRSASALRCTLDALARWAESPLATTCLLNNLRACRADGQVLVLGRALPPVGEGVRFWGERLLIPLGWRAEPDLPETTLLRALGAGADGLALLTAEGVEIVPGEALRPLTRAGVRLAVAGKAGTR